MANLFLKGRPDPVWLAVLILLAFALYLADSRLRLAEDLRGWIMAGMEPLQRVVALPVTLWHTVKTSIQSREELENERARLYQENLLLKTQMQTFWAVQEENRRLRAALNATRPLELDMLLAERIPTRTTQNNKTILVNRGRKDGVFVGQAALGAEGLLGQVIHVGPTTAEIMLINDREHAVPIRVARSGQRGIAQGDGKQLKVVHLPNNTDIQEGDLLITSGLGGIFPEGYPVAKVTSIAPSKSGPFLSITAEPLAPVDDPREVVLIWTHEAPVEALQDTK